MPAIFPELQPEELLYSGIARYSDMMCFPTAQAFWRSLYGDGQARVGIDLSRPLGRLMGRMPRGFAHSLGSLLRQHTLFPYLTFSMLPERRRRIEELLGTENPPKPVQLWFGTWKVKPPSFLRYCRTCVDKSREVSGFAYWIRCHQLPGVVVCPEHEEVLINTQYKRSIRVREKKFVSLERALEWGESRKLEVPPHLIGRAHQVAVDSLWLLQNPDVGDGVLLDRHKDWQYGHGWRHTKRGIQGNLKRKAFCRGFREFYDEEFLRLLSEGDDSLIIPESGGWVLRMAGQIKEEVAAPPLQHILLWQFLGLDGESFFKEPEDSPAPITAKSFPALEGPCPNTACRQHDPPVPRPLEVSEERKNESLTISCPECRFTYIQRFDCTSRRRMVIRNTGKLWDDRLRSLLKRDPPLTLMAIAEEMDFSHYMIQKHALRLNAWRSEWSDPVRKMVDRKSLAKKREKEKRRLKREEWLKTRKEFPGASRSDLWDKKRSIACYLSKNDREWYERNSPEKWKNRDRSIKKRWEYIDNRTLEEVKEEVNMMKCGSPDVRISIRGISIRIGQEGTLGDRILRNNIPKTENYLNRILESSKDFAKRRIRYAMYSFVKNGVVPSFSEFSKKARVKYGAYPVITHSAFTALRDYLEDQVPIPEQWKLTTEQTRKSTM